MNYLHHGNHHMYYVVTMTNPKSRSYPRTHLTHYWLQLSSPVSLTMITITAIIAVIAIMIIMLFVLIFTFIYQSSPSSSSSSPPPSPSSFNLPHQHGNRRRHDQHHRHHDHTRYHNLLLQQLHHPQHQHPDRAIIVTATRAFMLTSMCRTSPEGQPACVLRNFWRCT